ncbi:MAG: AAA family ATPase, partial [Deltaproteobacteria bacterium]|nr:AAA family ATPase [Deltaproteobacteria bacterium]
MAQRMTVEEVPIERLRWRCDPEKLRFESTEDLPVIGEIIGQERALEAIRLGLDIDGFGYNIFVAGLVGTGRKTAIEGLLEEIDTAGKIPNDICYANNFKNPDMPRMIPLPASRGNEFKEDMDNLIETLKKKIPLIFEDERYLNKKKEILEKFREQQAAYFKEFEKKVTQEKFSLVQVQTGPYSRPGIFPIIDGNPLSFDQLEHLVQEGKLTAEEVERLREKQRELASELEDIFKKTRKTEKEIRQSLQDLDREVISPVVGDSISDIREKYDNEKINSYLSEVQESIMEDLARFTEKEEQPQIIPGLNIPQPPDQFTEYRVNVLVDNSDSKGAPIIVETTPNYRNLFGTMERIVDRSGIWRTDFSRIKAGSFLRANEGYLIIDALDALIEPGVWQTLKRTLKNGVVEMQTYDPFYLFATSALKPEPIQVDVKVIMVGDTFMYHLLYNYDEDFKKIFKVKADFDTVMDKNEEAINQYASLIHKICKEENLKPFDRSGVAAVVEYGVRLAGRQKKLT